MTPKDAGSHTPAALLDLHERSHRNVRELIEHCRALSADDLHRELDGFGYPSVQLQIHHALGAERYWLGVLEGRIDADEDAPAYPTIDDLEALRTGVAAATASYLRGVTAAELNTAVTLATWGGRERSLVPAQVILRTQTHLYHHQGQVLAMCRLLGAPGGGLDYPVD